MKQHGRLMEATPIDSFRHPDFKGCRKGIFLAGPMQRSIYDEDWRYDAIRILEDLNFDGFVLNPLNEHYAEMGKEAYERQTDWEREAMYNASAIVFWIPRDDKHPGLTTNVEFGEWYKKDRIYVGFPKGSMHNRYIEKKCSDEGGEVFGCLEDMLKVVVADLNRDRGTFFTSDTHFLQQRTLELSRRPFSNLKDMDLNLVSNWNKKVGPNATVFHAGDFIQSRYIFCRRCWILSISENLSGFLATMTGA